MTAKKNSELSASYKLTRGLCECDGNERILSHLENLYIDHASGEDKLESIPGFREIYNDARVMNGLHVYNSGGSNEQLLLHFNSVLYKISASALASSDKPSATFVSNANSIPSTSLRAGNRLYIITGYSIAEINKKASYAPMGSDLHNPYVPTVYENGVKKEDRNLLTTSFKERYVIASTKNYLYESPGIHYRIDEESGTATVTGADAPIPGILHIPSYTTIGGKSYEVVKIAPHAFEGRSDIIELVTSAGLKEIGTAAFRGCTSLSLAAISETVEKIERDCFSGCSSLMKLYLGISISKIGHSAFSDCTALQYYSYSGDAEDIAGVEGYEEIVNITPNYLTSYESLVLSLPIHAKYASVNSVEIGGVSVEFSYSISATSTPTVLVHVESAAMIVGKEITLNCTFGEDDKEGCLSSDFAAGQPAINAVLKCTVGAFYEGRLFFSGNPHAPSMVIYSARNEDGSPNSKYFPAGNYFMAGSGNSVVAMMNCTDTLTVHKSGDNGVGSIVHYKMETKDGKTRLYPVFTHTSAQSSGAVLNHSDDPLFYSNDGVYAIEKTSTDTYKTVCRSSAISHLLAREDPKAVFMTEWKGYLVLLGGEGRMYLGDKRTGSRVNGNFEYAWYPLTGVGCYENDETVYRYAHKSPDGFYVSDKIDDVAEGTVMSLVTDAGETVYYVEENNRRVAVYPTEEKRGGTFLPATKVAVMSDRLIFSTKNSRICVFNSDKKGIAPARIAEAAGFEEGEYKKVMGDKIHPDFYGFGSHAARYELATAFDDMGIPNRIKASVMGSLTVKCESLEDSSITCEVESDIESPMECIELHPKRFSFENLDFSRMSLTTRETQTVKLPDPTSTWGEKRILLHSDKFRAPMSVYSIDFRYKIKGNIS